ncbi:hypothetical protein K3495_g5798 [Podosphaera aphanis]|nr:hypothetical protein K3495_g5798 [Podosphaera aphanis]
MSQEVFACLRAFILFAQWEWSGMSPSAQLAINNRDCAGAGLSPFFLDHEYHAEPVQQVSLIDKALTPPIKRAENFVTIIREAQEYAAAAMATAQQLMEENSNKKRSSAPVLRVGDKVWLNLKNIHTPQPKKLAWVNAKYSVTREISPHVVELEVPSQICPRFHVDLLRKASSDPLPSQVQDDSQPDPAFAEGQNAEPEQTVERILMAERVRRGGAG